MRLLSRALRKQKFTEKLISTFVLTMLIAANAVFASDNARESNTLEFGIYGSPWMAWVRDHPTDLDFLIYQFGPKRSFDRIRKELEIAAEVDLEVVLTPKLSLLQHSEHIENSVAAAMQAIEGILDHVRDLPIAAITIGEENVFWDQKADVLNELYKSLHAKFPERRFFQWYSPSRRLNVPGIQWPALDSDGWVFDQYHMQDELYARYVSSMVALDRPLISVVWASPNWRPGAGSAEESDEWWETVGWRQFYDQVTINIENHIPTAFFLYELDFSQPARPVPLFRSKNSCSQAFLTQFVTRTLKTLREIDQLVASPADRPEWIPEGCLGYKKQAY